MVLGGGVLGVETAAALAQTCDNVTLVHRGPWLMEQQLDRQAGLLLEAALAERGVRCELSGIAAIAPDSVTLHNGRRLAPRAWCWPLAYCPTSPASASGIAALAASWSTSRCGPPSRLLAPLGSAAKSTVRRLARLPLPAQADILAARLAGDAPVPFAHTDSGMRLKVTGVELFSAGRVTAQPEDTVWDAWIR